MTQQDKELLLKDLCARLHYGVKILHEGWNYEWDDELSTVERVVGIDDKFIYTKVIDMHNGEEYRDDKWSVDTFDDKLFLRPMSSMTEEEFAEYEKANDLDTLDSSETLRENMKAKHRVRISKWYHGTDWLNAHHFDYRGLIEKGLAIEAPKEMYN